MKHNRHEDEHSENHERWLISYADFMTLMFAFFVVLYATSNRDTEKTKEFQESIKRYLIKAGAFGESGQQINPGEKGNSAIEPPIQTYKDGRPETVAMLDQAETFLETNLSKEDREKYVLEITTDEWGVRLVLPSAPLYAAQSERFRAEAMPFLGKLSALLAQSKRKILIEGHVSSSETGGGRSTWDFASARAVNLLRYMQKKDSISPERLAAASLADSRPVYIGDKAKLNSRIEIVLLNQDMEW